jgi:hypothetical protein
MTNHFDIVIYVLSNSNPMEVFGDRRDEEMRPSATRASISA